MIKKPSILITSLGRTGTEFFARFFSEIIPTATSIHEPDIFQNTGVENKWMHYLQQVRRAGIWRMVVLKAIGKWTLVKIADEKFLNKLNSAQAVNRLKFQREAFIQAMPGSIYVEANIGYYGLLDITSQVFRQHKAVFVIRDGRDWVRSHMNWGEFYGKIGFRKFISHNWPAASEMPNDPYVGKWNHMTRFEKLCWAWRNLNEYALRTLSDNPDVRVFQFEKIFSRDLGYQTLDDLVSFTTSQPGINPENIGNTKGWLERRSHQSPEGFPSWNSWTGEQKRFFEKLCGPLMEKMDYKI